MGVLSPQKTPPLSSIMEQAMTKKNQQSFTHLYTHGSPYTDKATSLSYSRATIHTILRSFPTEASDRSSDVFQKLKVWENKETYFRAPAKYRCYPYQSTSLELPIRGLHATHICRFSPDPWNDRIELTVAPHLHTMRDNKSRSCYTYMNFDHTAIQPSPNEKSTISLILLFKKICRIVCHPLPAPLPPTTVGDVTPLPAPQLCLFNVLSLSEFVPCEYVLDLV